MKTSLWHMPSTVRKEGGPTCDTMDVASFLSDVCHDVEIKSYVQLLQGETFAPKSESTHIGARLDIKAN